MEDITWLVANFFEENTIEVIPQNWICDETNTDETLCYFPPPMTPLHFARLVRNRCTPVEDEWGTYKLKILGSYSSYETAALKAKKALETDELTSHSETISSTKRKRIRNRKFIDSDGSCSSSGIDDTLPSNKCTASLSQSTMVECKQKKKVYDCSQATHQRKKRNRVESTSSDTSDGLSNKLLPEKSQRNSQLKSQRNSTAYSIPKQPAASSSHSGSTSLHCNAQGALPKQTTILEKEPSSSGSTVSIATRVSSQCDEATSQEPGVKRIVTEGSVQEIFRRKVLSKLFKIEHGLQQLEANMLILLERSTAHQKTDHESKDDSNLQEILELLPITEEEQFVMLESRLEDKNQFKCFAQHLSRNGGDSAEVMSKQLMYKIFTNLFGQNYSWEGAKGKKVFKCTQTAKVIIEAIRLNGRTADATDDVIIKGIKKWLVRAKERHVFALRKLN